jgi:glutamine amidotransferase
VISIIDYGLGNIKALLNTYKRLNIPAEKVSSCEGLGNASRLILPGVGAFDHAMTRLNNSGLREKLDELVLEKGVPILGICVGMQMMARTSEEGVLPGLCWIEADVKKISSEARVSQYLPHMGWNDVTPLNSNILFSDLDIHARFYFLHSYFFDCKNANDAIAITEYGNEFVSAVNSKNIFGVQFHPEKSHHFGIQLLKNFANCTDAAS